MTRKLDDTLNLLGDEGTSLSQPLLGNLSDLNARELAQFQGAWQSFTDMRRLELLSKLIELADEHIEYDFRAIFMWTLHDVDPIARVLSIEGLWEDERPQLIAVFATMLQEDADSEVRAAAATALGRFVYWGELGSLPSHHAETAANALWDCLHHAGEIVHVRRRALEGIAASSDPMVIRAIENALYESDHLMHVSALHAMGRSADPRWIPYLTPELAQTDRDLRLEAVRALGELEARAAVPHIIQLIAVETDAEVRLAALASLGQIGGDAARKALESAASWDDEDVVSASEAALEELLSGETHTYELINEVLGLDDEFDEDLLESFEEDFYEDPLDAEIRRLLDERDEWLG